MSRTITFVNQLAGALGSGFGVGALDVTNRDQTQEVYLLLFNKTNVPVAGDVPDGPVFPVAAAVSGASGRLSRDRQWFGTDGMACPKGLAWAVSTSPLSYVSPADASKYLVEFNLVG